MPWLAAAVVVLGRVVALGCVTRLVVPQPMVGVVHAGVGVHGAGTQYGVAAAR